MAQANQTAVVANIEVAAMSKFVVAQCAAFVKSKVALYVALALDVHANHNGTMPAGYPDAVGALLGEEEGKFARKYCTIIRPMLESQVMGAEFVAFGASAEGARKAVAFVMAQTKARGYTNSMEDIKAMFKGVASTKEVALARAQADAIRQDADKNIAAAKGALAATEKDAADAESNAQRKTAEVLAAAAAPTAPAMSAQGEVERGETVVGNEHIQAKPAIVWNITVVDNGPTYNIDLPTTLPTEALTALMGELADMLATREAVTA
ncbi:hypothetical protein Lumi_118 [Xylophilus phage Lumi]|nr:hypothetical protein Lumi_003 [Xylophilus phage Lumi]WCD44257.1 hypothetical protein Lumi_118 [Xylophilus phage Lumi]